MRVIELRHLRYFIAVAEALNFSRAAAALNTAQPSLSQQIRQLEAAVGIDLFDRGKRQIALTSAGVEFLHDARTLVAGLETAVAHAREAGRGMRGELRVAYTVSAMMSTLPAAIRAFRRGHPDVRISLRALPPAELAQTLRRRDADAGVMLAQTALLERAADLAFVRLRSLPIAALVPAGHRLARRRAIALDDIGSETLILFARHLAMIADVVLALCSERGFAPARIEEVERIETILGLVAAGEGVSIVPRLYENLGYPGLRYLGLRPQPAPFTLAVVWSKGSTSALTAGFVAECKRISGA
jgi:DNA-binding transcriptional LysR family regulator